MWDHAGGAGPLSIFWRAVRDVDPEAHDESGLAGAREGTWPSCATQPASLRSRSSRSPWRSYATFDAWWEPFTLGVGPAGDYVARLDDARRDALRRRCAGRLPPAPFEVSRVGLVRAGPT